MAVKMVAGESLSPLLADDTVRSFVDFNGFPAVRSNSGYWRSASFIIGVEVAAKFAVVGIGSNLISYLTGPLGLSTAAAAANVNAWSGTASLLPLLGGFVADSFLGRYRTIIIAASVYILGLGFLSLSAALHSFSFSSSKTEANKSSSSPSPLEFIAFFFSLYLVAFAEGGIRPCLQAFGADQFDEVDKNESKAKSSFFNWWFFSMCSGSLLAFSALNYIQENMSWALGFGIPCIVICFALITFLLGSPTYRFHVKSDEGTPFGRIKRVFVSAARDSIVNRQIHCNDQGISEFLDKEVYGLDNSGDDSICSRRDIEDTKTILGLLPIWCTCLGYAIVSSQVSTLFTKQGSAMDRHIISSFQIPAASLQSVTSLTVLVMIPIYDRILVPVASVITKKPTGISMLQRVGAGLLLSFLSMVTAALVERQRLALAIADEANAAFLMSVWWLAPQYLLFGMADVFVVVGLQEFFYSQAPRELKSIGVAMYLSIIGIGNFLSSFMIFVIEKATGGEGRDSWFSNNLNRAHLDYFYWLLAGLSAVTMMAYVCFAKSYVYRRKDMVS